MGTFPSTRASIACGVRPHCAEIVRIFMRQMVRKLREATRIDIRCPRPGSSIATLDRVRTYAMKNRMRQLRTCGTVRGEGREALTYSENPPKVTLSCG
jgi:hypothetical protein